MKIRTDSVGFIVLLGACAAMPPLSVDMGQPAISPIARALLSTPAAVAYALSLFMLGFATTPVVFGPISDRYGRRPVLLAGCILFGGASWGCALAHSMTAFMICRLIQGAGAGVGTMLALAIIRDVFEGAMARARLSYMSVLSSLAPMIAPTLGVWILTVSGWRSIYGALGTLGVILIVAVTLGLDESAPPARRQSLAPRQLLANYATVLGSGTFRNYALVSALMTGCLFAYIAASPLLLINALGASLRLYGLLFACTSFGIMAGAMVNARLNARGVPASRLLATGLTSVTTVCMVLVILSLKGAATLATVTPLLLLATFASALVGPNATVAALHPHPEIAGTASSIIVCVQWTLGAGAGALAGFLFDGHTPRGITEVMAGCALAATAVYWTFVRPHERRLHAATSVPAEATERP
ncbi:MAG: multidrug effflux MFS transporter [Acidobacteriia bacterium]|nr:multidrug effflux MFS transporter [Terriglobia bacterium]